MALGLLMLPTSNMHVTDARGLACLPSIQLSFNSSSMLAPKLLPCQWAAICINADFIIITANPKLWNLGDLMAFYQHLVRTILSSTFMWEETKTVH